MQKTDEELRKSIYLRPSKAKFLNPGRKKSQEKIQKKVSLTKNQDETRKSKNSSNYDNRRTYASESSLYLVSYSLNKYTPSPSSTSKTLTLNRTASRA